MRKVTVHQLYIRFEINLREKHLMASLKSSIPGVATDIIGHKKQFFKAIKILSEQKSFVFEFKNPRVIMNN